MSDPTSTENRACWLTGKLAHPFTISSAPMPVPGPTELLLRIHSVAMNPVDAGIQFSEQVSGLVETYPTILGLDCAGTIVSVGSSISASSFAPGDRVLAAADAADAFKRNLRCFQLYTVVSENNVTKLPDQVSFSEACVLPLALATAAAAMFGDEGLALKNWPQHPFPSPQAATKVFLIWGGSSSVGSCAIQLARAAGFRVAATASAHNLQYIRNLGVEWAFDHRAEGVVDAIVAELGKTGLEFGGAFDAVMPPETIAACAQVAYRLGGLQAVGTVMPQFFPGPEATPEGVKLRRAWGSFTERPEMGKQIFGTWLAASLADGSVKCKPDPEIVGKGLESVQEAVDRMAKGVSATKLVVDVI